MRTIYRLNTGVTRLKSKAKQLSNKFVFGTAVGVTALGLVVIPIASAASPVVVTPSNTHGWYIQDTGTGGTVSYVASPGAPLGNGAVEFKTTIGDDYTRFKNDTTMKLSSISNLSYQTKQIDAPTQPTDAAVNLRLYIDRDNNGVFDSSIDDVLVYEPYYNGTVSSTSWQTWNITQTSGYWWSNFHYTYNGHVPNSSAGGVDTNFTLSDVVHDFQNMNVISIGMGTGTDNSPWTVQADALTINNTTTYNFENEVSNKDLCKNNGWKTGGNFKNQGDCVSFFATGGKNTASGQ